MRRRSPRLLTALIPLLLLIIGGTPLPRAVEAAPAYTTSRYMKTINTTNTYNLGCAQGTALQSGVIVLDFGRPKRVDGVLGTKLFNNAFATIAQIREAAKSFVQGWYNCSNNTPRLVLVIGTSNDNGDGVVGIGHGTAWANMVDDVHAWVIAQGYDWQVDTHGGSDLEPGFSLYVKAHDWVEGYDSANSYLMFNYGSADGCPDDTTGHQNNPCNNGWTQDGIQWLSWGAQPSVPLPEIYSNLGTHALQWEKISLRSWRALGGAMVFRGTLTQWIACQQVGCNAELDNTPAQGWQQLYDALNDGQDGHPAQPILQYSSDISQTGA